jgi:hypothetical protein
MMTSHPMFLEYTSNAFHSHLGGAFTSIEHHSFETLAAARHALRLVGLRIGAKTDERTWRIELGLSPGAPMTPNIHPRVSAPSASTPFALPGSKNVNYAAFNNGRLHSSACRPIGSRARSLGGDRVRKAEFDPDQLKSLIVAAFERLGKPEDEAQELARAILKAAERLQGDDQESPDRVH